MSHISPTSGEPIPGLRSMDRSEANAESKSRALWSPRLCVRTALILGSACVVGSFLPRLLRASTTDRRLSTVGGFYRFAHIDGRITSNPAQYVRRPKVPTCPWHTVPAVDAE